MNHCRVITTSLSIISLCLIVSCQGESGSSSVQTASNIQESETASNTVQIDPQSSAECTKEYSPVCAQESFNGITASNTYSNSCVMKANATGKIVSVTTGSCNTKPVGCSKQYNPVCVQEEVNGTTSFNTYGNACMVGDVAKGHVLNITLGACPK